MTVSYSAVRIVNFRLDACGSYRNAYEYFMQ